MSTTTVYSIGQTVTFKHRHTYAAPSGSTLTGVITGMELLNDGPYKGTLSYSIYSLDAEMQYGMPDGTFTLYPPQSAAARLTNLRIAEKCKRLHMSKYPVWQERFATEPDFAFFGPQIELVTREMESEA